MQMHYHAQTIQFKYLNMPAAIETESTLTDRYQTTVPETVRRALRLGKRDKIRYSVRPGGEVLLSKAAEKQDQDPVLGQFLNFLARDITTHPQQVQQVDAKLAHRIQKLAGKVTLDLNAALSPDDE